MVGWVGCDSEGERSSEGSSEGSREGQGAGVVGVERPSGRWSSGVGALGV